MVTRTSRKYLAKTAPKLLDITKTKQTQKLDMQHFANNMD